MLSGRPPEQLEQQPGRARARLRLVDVRVGPVADHERRLGEELVDGMRVQIEAHADRRPGAERRPRPPQQRQVARVGVRGDERAVQREHEAVERRHLVQRLLEPSSQLVERGRLERALRTSPRP